MNTITTTVKNFSIPLAVGLFVAFALIFGIKAQAAGDDIFPEAIFAPMEGGSDMLYPDYIDYAGGSDMLYPDYVDYPSYSDYSSGFSMPYSSGFSSMGSFSSIPFTPSQARSLAPSNSNTNVNINENTCTGNSCNTTFNDNSVFNAPTVVTTDSHAIVNFSQPTQFAPPVTYTPPTYSYPPTYTPPTYQPPVSYPRPTQPYVTLSAVPYTGYEMGPVATALYWGFLVLWCLIAAYLIAVKKVQNKIAAWFTGSTPAHVFTQAHAPKHVAPLAPASPQFAGIDPFIASQINRA